MALIIKCAGCRKRLRDAQPCPCGSSTRRLFIDYRPHGRYGKRVRMLLPATITGIDEAREIEAALRAVIRKKQEAPVVPSDASVDGLFWDYLAWYRLRRSPRSVEDLNYTYKRHISRIIGNEKITSLNIAHVNLYQTLRRVDGVSNRTINKELDYISGFLRWCRDTHDIPCGVPRDRLPCKRPVPIVMTANEVSAIIEAAEPLYRAFFLCLYSMGLRKAEARGLKWTDFDFLNRTARVIQKGGSYKTLPVSDSIIKALKAIPKPKPREGEGKDREIYVFQNRYTGKPISDVRDALRRACSKAGVTKKVTPHLFRHSVATHMIDKNINLRIIQLFLGHSAIGTTQWYTHVGAENLRDAQNQIENTMIVHNKRNNINKRVHLE